MVVPVEQLSIKATASGSGGTSSLGSTRAALGDRLGQIINVKTDFGATGDGSTDDRAAIQNALDAAFGPASSPHGDAGKFTNVPVYFPAGNYKVAGSLYLTNVASGWIFGAGANSTRIFHSGALGGNSLIPVVTATITGSISGTTLTVAAFSMGGSTPLSEINYDVLMQYGSGVATTISGAGITVGTVLSTPGQLTYTPQGTNGATAGTTTFTDSTANAFTSGMVGHRLNITAGTTGLVYSNYRIVSFISVSQVTLNFNLPAGSGATWRVEGYTGTYTISPSHGVIGSESMSLAAPGSEITPLWMVNGFAYSTFEKMNLSIGGANTVGFFLFENGLQGSTTTIMFNELLIESAATGVLAGYQSPGLCSECQYFNVIFSGCGYGIRLRNFNALNHNIYGGGANSCTVAAYSVDAGQINLINGISLAGNTLDLISLSNTPISIIGGRTESSNCIQVAGNPIYISGFIYQPTTAGTFVSAPQGSVVMDGCIYAPGGGAGFIIDFSSQYGTVLMNRCVSQSSVGTINGSSGAAKVYVRGCDFSANPSVFTGFSGQIAEYSIGTTTNLTTVASLPTASAIFKGVRMWVSDSTVAVTSSTNFGAIVAGGSTNTVPVWCDGTNWRIG